MWAELARDFLTRAPGDSAFDETFQQVVQMVGGDEVELIALGAGSARKEARLLQLLAERPAIDSQPVQVTFIDISADLLATSSQVTRGARCIVADIGAVSTRELARQLKNENDYVQPEVSSQRPASSSRDLRMPGGRKIITLFGVIPALDSLAALEFVTLSMNLDDLFVFSVNLIKEGHDASELSSFYDTPRARSWLQQVLLDNGVDPAVSNWRVVADQASNGLHAAVSVRALASIGHPAATGESGSSTDTVVTQEVEVFRSHRHTRRSVEELADELGLAIVGWQESPSGEEGVALSRLRA